MPCCGPAEVQAVSAYAMAAGGAAVAALYAKRHSIKSGFKLAASAARSSFRAAFKSR